MTSAEGATATSHGGPIEQLRERLVGELRGRLIEQAVSLPLGDQAALTRVVGLCERGADARQIAAEASADEGFSTVLLRVANSAASASATRIEDVPTAVTRLGARFVQRLAISAPCLRLLAAPSDELANARQAVHRHSVLTGMVAFDLASDEIDPDRAIAAGLVHNVGA